MYKTRKPRPGYRFYYSDASSLLGRTRKYIHVIKVHPKLIVTEEYDLPGDTYLHRHPLPCNVGNPDRVVEYNSAQQFAASFRNHSWSVRVEYIDDMAPLDHIYPALRGEVKEEIDLCS